MGTPRHRDPSRFGTHINGAWVPYEVIEGRLAFACGHTQKIIVGSIPGVSEEKQKAFLTKVAASECGVCRATSFGRLRYAAETPGKDQV